MRRRRQSSEQACSRCGNDFDLRRYLEGTVLCLPCLVCPHGTSWIVNNTCTWCLRNLHTMWSFTGPRIRHIPYYVKKAREEYGLRSYELEFWTFEETETAMNLLRGGILEPVLRGAMHVHAVLPPHLRLSEPGGNP